MLLEEKLHFLEEIMDLDPDTLKPEDELENYDEWDSITATALIAEVRNRFEKTLDISVLKNFETVQDICDFLG